MDSRKDRNKKLYEDLAGADKGKLFARRQITQESNSDPQWTTEDMETLPDEGQTPTARRTGGKQPPQGPGPSSNGKAPRPKKPQKRKKHRFLRFFVKLILLLLIFCVGAYFAGKWTANQEADMDKQEAITFNGFKNSDGSSNILLLGSDSREGENARADTIMVLQLDGPAKKPKLISFMRDTLVDIPGVGQTKINAAYAYGGAELLRKTLKQNFGIECRYYTIVDFQSFESVIDTLFPNGVTIDAEKDMSKNLEVPIKAGKQQMDGLTLLQYARFRMDEEGDFGRVRRQQQVMNAVFSGMKNPLVLAKLPFAGGKVMGEAATNLPMSYLLKNTISIAKGAGGVDRLSIPVDDSWSYGVDYAGGSVLVIDQDKNQKAIKSFWEK